MNVSSDASLLYGILLRSRLCIVGCRLNRSKFELNCILHDSQELQDGSQFQFPLAHGGHGGGLEQHCYVEFLLSVTKEL